MIKPDEHALAARVLGHPEGQLRNESGGLFDTTKRELYILLKWAGNGWWEYGVSVRAGWLTPLGRVALSNRQVMP